MSDYENEFDSDVYDFGNDILNLLPCGFSKAREFIEEGTGKDYSYCCAVLFKIIDENAITNDNGYLKY